MENFTSIDQAANSTNSTVMDDGEDDYFVTEERAEVAAILPKPFALLSMICSYVMIREVVAEHRETRRVGMPIMRMLASVAVGDIIYSFATFLGTWPAPREGMEDYMHINGNVGTQGTCTFQGMLVFLGLMGSVLSSAALSIYYLKVVVYHRTDRDLERLERYLLSFIWIFAIAYSIYPIPLELYNVESEFCSLQSVPAFCTGEPGNECVRGSDPSIHQAVVLLIPFLCLLVSTCTMIAITCQVRKLENKTRKYGASSLAAPSASMVAKLRASSRASSGDDAAAASTSPGAHPTHNYNSNDPLPNATSAQSAQSAYSSTPFRGDVGAGVAVRGRRTRANRVEVNRRKSRAVAIQGICYALAFLVTYLLSYVSMIWYLIDESVNHMLDNFAFGVTAPSAGIFNFIVFARIRTMKTPEGKFMRALFCCSCFFRKKDSSGPTSYQNSATATRHQRQQPTSTEPERAVSKEPETILEEEPQLSVGEAVAPSSEEGLINEEGLVEEPLSDDDDGFFNDEGVSNADINVLSTDEGPSIDQGLSNDDGHSIHSNERVFDDEDPSNDEVLSSDEAFYDDQGVKCIDV